MMKLTDNEKREILKALEADKPLPDKYRFILFDDKRHSSCHFDERQRGEIFATVKQDFSLSLEMTTSLNGII